jgi:hypothetical protein
MEMTVPDSWESVPAGRERGRGMPTDMPGDMQKAARAFRFDRLPEDFHDDPYPIHAALRRHAPVHPLGERQTLITRYMDCERVYKEPTTFSSDKKREFLPKFRQSPLYLHQTSSLVFNEALVHW